MLRDPQLWHPRQGLANSPLDLWGLQPEHSCSPRSAKVEREGETGVVGQDDVRSSEQLPWPPPSMALAFGLIKQQQNGSLNTFCALAPLLPVANHSCALLLQAFVLTLALGRPCFSSVPTIPICQPCELRPHLSPRLPPVAPPPLTPFLFAVRTGVVATLPSDLPSLQHWAEASLSFPEGPICAGCSTWQGACR